MLQALHESRKARSLSSPNPNVGAVIVKNNCIISKGHTQKAGKEHAEVYAVNNASENLKGSSLYVTLEPCSHHGKTPPCVDLIIKKGIKNVFIGIKDPNPIVSGNGIKKLKKAEINVKINILKNKILDELQWYIKYIQKKTPYITMKSGISLDGKITDYKNNSRWITSGHARKLSQKLRKENDGIICGINTIKKDNPSLTYRLTKRKTPFYRIILDTAFSINNKYNVLKPIPYHKTIIAIGKKNINKKKISMFEKMGCKILLCNIKNDLIDLNDLLKQLYNMGIAKIIVEGGSHINFSFLKSNKADKLILYIAPILLGGNNSKNFIGGEGFLLKHHKKLEKGKFFNILSDNKIFEGYLNYYVHRNN